MVKVAKRKLEAAEAYIASLEEPALPPDVPLPAPDPEPEPAPEDEPAPDTVRDPVARNRWCKSCGRQGHYAKTCTGALETAIPAQGPKNKAKLRRRRRDVQRRIEILTDALQTASEHLREQFEIEIRAEREMLALFERQLSDSAPGQQSAAE
jgi:hypothetical protein